MPLTRITSNVIANGTIQNEDISLSTIIDRAKLQLSSPAGVKTVYIAVRTDGIAGSGTELDPYDAGGSTEQIKADKYDAIIMDRNKCPEGCTIRLLNGTFCTNGTQFWPEYSFAGPTRLYRMWYPANCSVIGNGQSSTIIKQIAAPQNATGKGQWLYEVIAGNSYESKGPVMAIYGNPNKVGTGAISIVSDLTIDCNWQNIKPPVLTAYSEVPGSATNRKLESGAVIVGGDLSQNTQIDITVIERVTSINSGGQIGTGPNGFVDVEAFAINSRGEKIAAIKNSSVVKIANGPNDVNGNPTAGYQTPFIASSLRAISVPIPNTNPVQTVTTFEQSGVSYIDGCYVNGIGEGGVVGGIHTAFGSPQVCTNSFAENCMNGIYSDTGFMFNIRVLNCRFRNCNVPIHINLNESIYPNQFSQRGVHVIDNLYIENCTIELGVDSTSFYKYVRVLNTINFKFINNRVLLLPDAPQNGLWTGQVERCGNVEITGNVIDQGAFGFAGFSQMDGCVADNNFDENAVQRFDCGEYLKTSITVQGNHVDNLWDLESLTSTASEGTAINIEGAYNISRDVKVGDEILIQVQDQNNVNKSSTWNGNYIVTAVERIQENPYFPRSKYRIKFAVPASKPSETWSNTNRLRLTPKNAQTKNGLELFRAMEYIGSLLINGAGNQYNTIPTIFLKSGEYQINGQNVNIIRNFNIIGIGRPEDIILKTHRNKSNNTYQSQVFSVGSNANKVNFENLTFMGLSTNSSATYVSGSSEKLTFKNCIFTISNVLQNVTKQGTVLGGFFYDCKFLNPFNIAAGAEGLLDGYAENCEFLEYPQQLGTGPYNPLLKYGFKNCSGNLNPNLFDTYVTSTPENPVIFEGNLINNEGISGAGNGWNCYSIYCVMKNNKFLGCRINIQWSNTNNAIAENYITGNEFVFTTNTPAVNLVGSQKIFVGNNLTNQASIFNGTTTNVVNLTEF